ncbi:MAG: hypothetical protein SPK90_06155 [Bacteroidales bacterium]|nr:hypothetical protein [Bacteroidales bacterium]MDY6405573.1 hypothetical protein [Bacteroidales bacterium]
MKKNFLTLMLAIVSSVWMANEASNWCMPSVRTLTEPWIEVNGTFQAEGFPCEPDEECPPCLTIVLVTSDKTYYLVTDDGQLIEYLDTIQLGTKATVSGIPFTHGSYDYIQVSHIETGRTSQLPSLCDEWNVWYDAFSGPKDSYMIKYYLSTDTIINEQLYTKLCSDKDYQYYGVFREGSNRDIYFLPMGSEHEYLIYAFNAQVGDTLSNLWVGGYGEDYQGVVQAISSGNPRIFTIDVDFEDDIILPIEWIEGVGSPETPWGLAVVPTVPADIGVYNLLCAYKNGEPVYVSQIGEKRGCYGEYSTADTIPLFSYTGDDPGSSTVDPVDPNQVVATLGNEELTIREYTGTEITYVLTHRNNAPSRELEPQPTTFENEVVIELTEYGPYELQLSNEAWDYIIIGKFYYGPQGVEMIGSDLTADGVQKVIIDGQLLLRKGDKTYTLTGQEIKR